MKSLLIIVATTVVLEALSLFSVSNSVKGKKEKGEISCKDSNSLCTKKAAIEGLCTSALVTREEPKLMCGETCNLCHSEPKSENYSIPDSMKSVFIIIAAIVVTEAFSFWKYRKGKKEEDCKDIDTEMCRKKKATIEDFCNSAFIEPKKLKAMCGKTCDLCHTPPKGQYYEHSREPSGRLLGL